MKEGFKMKRKKSVILIFVLCFFSFILCGCWNYREIDNLAIVAGLAIDKDIKTNKYLVTTEIINTQAQGNSSNVSSQLYESEGESIFSAVRNTIEKTGLRLFWSDAKVVIISEAIAHEGMIPVIDWISRDSELRADMWILVSHGDSAQEILKNKVRINPVVSYHLNDAMTSGSVLSKFADSRLSSFVDGINEKSQAVATVQNEIIDGYIAPVLKGSAVFKKDKLVGYLDGIETLYMLMLRNKIKEGLITIKNVTNSDTSVTLEIFNNETKLKPFYENGVASMTIDIYPTVAIDEVEGTKDFMNEVNLKILQQDVEKRMEERLRYLVIKLQKDYYADVLGFGEIFDKKKPRISHNFKNNGEDIFENMKTQVRVHLQIKGSGKMIKPVAGGK